MKEPDHLYFVAYPIEPDGSRWVKIGRSRNIVKTPTPEQREQNRQREQRRREKQRVLESRDHAETE